MNDDLILDHKARIDGIVIDWPHGPIGAVPGDPNSRPPEDFTATARAGERKLRQAEQANQKLAAVMQVQWLRDRLAVAKGEAEKSTPLDLNPIGRSRRRAARDLVLARARSVAADLAEDLAAALETARKIGVTDDELGRRVPQSWRGAGKAYVYVDKDGEPVPYGSPAAAFSFRSEDDPALARLRATRGTGPGKW